MKIWALRQKETQGETQFHTKIDGFSPRPLPPPLMLMFFFLSFRFFEFHPVYDQTQGFNAVFSLLYKKHIFIYP
jgi:hypothetical protein